MSKQLIQYLLIFASICASSSAVAAESNDTQLNAALQAEVEQLAKKAYKARTDRNITLAIELFKEALVKNKPLAKLSKPPGCMGHHSAQFFLAGSLASIYQYEKRWSDAETILETYPREFNDDKRLAELLMNQGKYGEARAILRKFVPELKKPTSIGCGNPMEHYLELKQMFAICEGRTASLTEKDLLDIDLAREKRRALLQQD